MKKKIFDQVYEIVEKIPKGKVMTYGQVATKLGTNPKVIGYALHANKKPQTIPCHRIVHKDGELAGGYAFGGAKKQMEILTSEGVGFSENKVDMKKYLYG